MLALILTILFGLGFAYFASQNTVNVVVRLNEYTQASIPLYFVVLGALLLGVFISWIISVSDAIVNAFTLRGKDNVIRETKRSVEDLSRKVLDLELENAKLKGEKEELEKVTPRPGFFSRFRPT